MVRPKNFQHELGQEQWLASDNSNNREQNLNFPGRNQKCIKAMSPLLIITNNNNMNKCRGMNDDQIFSHLKDLVERTSERILSDDEIKFMREYEEKFIMRIVNPSQKTLSRDKLLSTIETFVRQNRSLVPSQLSFDIIPILRNLKTQLE